jgi:hypothetical protein
VQAVTRRDFEIIRCCCQINIFQTSKHPSDQIRLYPPGYAAYKEIQGVFIGR